MTWGHSDHKLLLPDAAGNLPPTFTRDNNNAVLSESAPVGHQVFQLQGSDPEGSPVHYGLFGTDYLRVDRDTGVVTVVKSLDREVTN
uniref:Cadherin domain-containing protein n=1 Tax=Timema genevievae TaxID=629358 RepID=A0A7R9JS55_TIMGE|nr:unnamed protein product [Timema genevievae]